MKWSSDIEAVGWSDHYVAFICKISFGYDISESDVVRRTGNVDKTYFKHITLHVQCWRNQQIWWEKAIGSEILFVDLVALCPIVVVSRSSKCNAECSIKYFNVDSDWNVAELSLMMVGSFSATSTLVLVHLHSNNHFNDFFFREQSKKTLFIDKEFAALMPWVHFVQAICTWPFLSPYSQNSIL